MVTIFEAEVHDVTLVKAERHSPSAGGEGLSTLHGDTTTL